MKLIDNTSSGIFWKRMIFGMRMFEFIHEHLEAKGLRLSSGTFVDATIIHSPSSTKNKEKARGPDIHQTKKRNQWYFGMKAHFGVDRGSKVIHAVVAAAANVHDSDERLHRLPERPQLAAIWQRRLQPDRAEAHVEG